MKGKKYDGKNDHTEASMKSMTEEIVPGLMAAGEYAISRMDAILNRQKGIPTAKIRTQLQTAMQKYAPVYRNGDDLRKGVKIVADVVKLYDQVTVEDKSLIWNTDLIEAMELENLLT